MKLYNLNLIILKEKRIRC